MTVEQIITRIKALGNPTDAEGMARFGINVEKAFGVRIPPLRKLAKEIGTDHELAQELWSSGYHEARILASMIDDPKMVSEQQMEAWVLDFNSWDLCDQVIGNLFDKTDIAMEKAKEWTGRPEEYVKRAGFAMAAWAALHLKKLPDSEFEAFFPLMLREATDSRNYVKKAVNWALRNIGKRNLALHAKAVALAEQMAGMEDKSARWIAADALRELRSEKILARLREKEGK